MTQSTHTDRHTPRRIALLGASGSIGRSALNVIEHSGGCLVPSVLTVHRQTQVLLELAHRYHPKTVVVSDPNADCSCLRELPCGTELLVGAAALEEVATGDDIDVVLSAIVGSAGLCSTRAALEANKTVALANKESLVVAGELLTSLVQAGHGRIIPVDSEHSAIYQCLHARRLTPESGKPWQCPVACCPEVERLILTASGGPFRGWAPDRLQGVTVADALAHPTWSMGKKITIDSATMVNKALELIEAHWLFGVSGDKLSVVIHPQSIIHSMVEFIDGAIVAQLSPPDMQLPIQFALYDSERHRGPSQRMDWHRLCQLEFAMPGPGEYPALALGYDVVARGGSCGVVFNTANEVAVNAFLHGQLPFDRIVPACEHALSIHPYDPCPDFHRLGELELWTRLEIQKWIS
ncbi:MAG: 1-deoxy-D-xylulose-5-phosphate reductoisomerase [Planctomycetia bacterium]|nr:1-deoxy-D-xylulose-5-phosphate reductoisomerase [Planctomycetia bacterium]